MRRWFSFFLTLTLLALPLAAFAAEPAPAKPAHQGKLVFVAMTGLEDLGTLSSSFRHAATAKKSGHLSDVVWLSWGRAVVALDPTVKAVPESVREEARLAQEAGVRLVACGNALAKFDIDPKTVTPKGVAVVPNGVTELARLIAEGYEVIRY